VQSRAFGLQVPLNEMGAFDLWAWQLWWLVGLWLGVRWAKDDLHLEDWAKRMVIPAAVTAVFFLVLRYAQVDGLVTLQKSGLLLDKWDFGIGRIIDFTAVAVLDIRFRSVLRHLAIRTIVMLGQALPVFCVHLLLCLLSTHHHENSDLTGWTAIAVVRQACQLSCSPPKLPPIDGRKAGKSGCQPQARDLIPCWLRTGARRGEGVRGF
jgi:hypothetical protein